MAPQLTEAVSRSRTGSHAVTVTPKAGRQWLREVPLPVEERHQVDSALRLLGAVETEIRLAEERVAQAALTDRRAMHLMTAPGVGLITAMAVTAVIGDVTRFPRPTQLVGYLGLDPRVRQSGARPAYTGHISRQGQAHARALLVEAAHSAIRVPGPLHAFYQHVRARRAKMIEWRHDSGSMVRARPAIVSSATPSTSCASRAAEQLNSGDRACQRRKSKTPSGGLKWPSGSLVRRRESPMRGALSRWNRMVRPCTAMYAAFGLTYVLLGFALFIRPDARQWR